MYCRVAFLACALLLCGSTASAQYEELEPGHFRCQASAGDYYNREIPALSVGEPVTVRFKLVTENPDPSWLEQAALYFETPQGRMRVQVGKADNDQQHMYLVTLRDDTGDSEVVDEYPVTNEWIGFTLTLGSNGVLQVASRGNTAKLDFQTTLPVKTELHCHSGVFEMQVVRPQG